MESCFYEFCLLLWVFLKILKLPWDLLDSARHCGATASLCSEVWSLSRVGPFSPLCALYSVVGRPCKPRAFWPEHSYHINPRESPGLRHKWVHEEQSTRKKRILQASEMIGTSQTEMTCSGSSEPQTPILCGCSWIQGPDPKTKQWEFSAPADFPQNSSGVQSTHFYSELIWV